MDQAHASVRDIIKTLTVQDLAQLFCLAHGTAVRCLSLADAENLIIYELAAISLGEKICSILEEAKNESKRTD